MRSSFLAAAIALLLAEDITGRISTLGKAQYHCESVERIDTVKLPPNLVPNAVRSLAGPATVAVEGWTAILCGKRYMFLVNFWPDPHGATTFAVTSMGPESEDTDAK